MSDELIELSNGVSDLARRSLQEIQGVTRMTKMLAINALVEASRAGEAGRGFAIVATEVGNVAGQIKSIADEMDERLAVHFDRMSVVSRGINADFRGTRLADLAFNMIEIIDRNLYERSCDVRWWATEAAVVDCAASPSTQATRFCSKRLGVILDSYTVYLDIWLADTKGRVLANGRPGKFPGAVGADVSAERWFQQAMATRDGTEFSVADIAANPVLGRNVATYAAAVRAGGEVNGKPLGVLGIFFDWQGQSQTVVDSVRLEPAEKQRTRFLMLDSRFRVIAASDRRGVTTETFPLKTSGKAMGHYAEANGNIVGFALTPGYETYKGLGWYGVIVQSRP